MTKMVRLLATTSALGLAALAATPAFAAGTTAGSSIVNNVSVNYTVGGVAQTQVNASNTFVVDRRITLTVTEPGGATTPGAPAQTGVAAIFQVTNTSNAPLDFALTLTQQATGATIVHGVTQTDDFDLTGLTLHADTNLNGSYDAGTDLVLTGNFLDEVAADTSRTVFAVGTIPNTRINGDQAGVQLVAQALEAGSAGTQGAVVLQTVGANTAAMDTVFNDTAGIADAVRDGQFSSRDSYTVSAATLTVLKTSVVISDPINGTGADRKLIPGATVEYCIQVANAAGGATAQAPAISDTLPAETTYVASSTFLNATVTGGVCNTDGTAGGTFAAGPPAVVSGTLSDVAAGTTRALRFRVTVN